MHPIKLTDARLTALMRLKAPEFDAFREMLEEVHRVALGDMADIADADLWRKLQGRARLARELLDLVNSSSELAAKFGRQ